MRKRNLLLLTTLIVLTSCNSFNKDEAKKEFSKYFSGKNEVVLRVDSKLYFENAKLDIKNIDKDVYSTSLMLHDNQVFFISVKEKQNFLKKTCEKILIRKCDFEGKNAEDVFSIEVNYKTEVDFRINKHNYYIEYKKDKVTYIDQFNVITKEYLNVESGENCSLDHYKKSEEKQYTIKQKNDIYRHRLFSHTILKPGYFEITEIESGRKRMIDEEYLMKTAFKDSFELFHPGPIDYVISNSHILLIYVLDVRSDNGSKLVFEYDFENDALDYKLLAFPEYYTSFSTAIYID